MTENREKQLRFRSGWPELTRQELKILRRAIPEVVKSIVAREEDPVKRSLLFISLEKEMLWAASSARVKFYAKRLSKRH